MDGEFDYIMKIEAVSSDEDDDLIVAGFASSGNLDYDDEIIDQESLMAAWAEYMTNPIVRYMHGKDSRHPDAIGSVLAEYTTKDGKILKSEFRDGKPYIIVKLSNAPDVADIRAKVKEGILRGFSVGGRAKKQVEFCQKRGKDINRFYVERLNEISIVDLPANKRGIFEIVKGCVGNNCSNICLNESKPIGNDDELNKNEELNMSENIELEMSELKDFIKSTVSDMITEQDTVEKIEGYDAAIKAAQDLKAVIEGLEAKVAAQAELLKAAPQPLMKEEDEDEEEKPDVLVTDKTDEDETEKAESRFGALEAEIAALKSSPLYKSEQVVEVEKTEVTEARSHLGSIIDANYR